MELFDCLLSIGRTNAAYVNCPCNQQQALEVMDRYGVERALVYHTLARDCNPDRGNAALAEVDHPRLLPVWAFETAYPAPKKPAPFFDDALQAGARAVMVNPAVRNVRVDRSVRIEELASLLEPRRIPLMTIYRKWDGREDIIDWYQLADFCKRHPGLPVIAWQGRSRSNRPMFDALATADNLHVVLSTMWQAQMIECVTETFGAARVLFSMGLPELHPSTFQAVLAYADVPEEVRRAVAGGTLEAMLEEADYAV